MWQLRLTKHLRTVRLSDKKSTSQIFCDVLFLALKKRAPRNIAALVDEAGIIPSRCRPD